MSALPPPTQRFKASVAGRAVLESGKELAPGGALIGLLAIKTRRSSSELVPRSKVCGGGGGLGLRRQTPPMETGPG